MDARATFIASIADGMVKECQGTKLFPSVMIAQACLESNNGASELSAKYHNYFGMKPGSHWTGPVVEMDTLEWEHGQAVKVKQPFRSYPTLDDCFKDHIKLLQTVGVYKVAGLFDCKTPEAQCLVLRKAGYATDPAYPQKLMSIINAYHLTKYDDGING